jgi:trehalose 6-phosphate synthase/phosphatase
LQGVSKGLVARRMLASMQERGQCLDFVLCIGDDRSDEDMFQLITTASCGDVLASTAEVFACTVGRKPSKAKYYLDDAAEVVRLMQGLAYVSEERALANRGEDEGSSLDVWE